MSTPSRPTPSELDRSTLRTLIGTPSEHDRALTFLQAGLLVVASLGLAAAGFQVGFRRAIAAELKDDPMLKLRDVGPVSGIPARELAARAFVKGSAFAFAGAAVFGVGIAYASAALRRRDEEADRRAHLEAENDILKAWDEATAATALPTKKP